MPHGCGFEWWHWMGNGRGDKGYLSVEMRLMIYNRPNEKCNMIVNGSSHPNIQKAAALVFVPIYSIIGKEGC